MKSWDAASWTRAVAWALLVVGVVLTGTLGLVSRVVEAVVNWAAALVFNPVVWLGVLVLGGSALMFAVSALLRRRRPAQRQLPGRRGNKPAAGPASSAGLGAGGLGDDMADIEAILRKHGIS